ncbi:alpha/beta fold hydrolase [Heliophilum fasciatum]|uniref:Pimeloyl-ACP methyl ester carboxylesterase n=1 Tax=Heliophilum fasciatum TaxID=35700 RepID=A0A4R2RMC7_9FIRM|nr:alpha/beta hydrolase [Heliophilum fasciatum]MCW2277581.1 pimeloyl-ACP methyl ester carboxylesterase [Heliophilum fasciatum]TCP65130.1 pimeloyl-ACP methyl ester carboxylesterase [Heliophilum fasciatum]
MASVTVNGVNLYYEVHGPADAPVLLFTHGAGWDHQQWEPQVAAFSATYRTIVWDVRGHGQSSCPLGPMNPDDFSRDLIALLDHLGVARAVLIGLSMGGHISLRAAVQYPERVAGLILMGTPVTSAYNWIKRLRLAFWKRSLRRLLMEIVDMSLQGLSFIAYGRSIRKFSMDKLAQMHARALSTLVPENADYFYRVTAQHPKERWERIWHVVSRMELLEGLPHVACPTLVLEGEGDWMMRRQHHFICEYIPGSERKMVCRAGHATSLDNPEEVNQYLTEFLTTKPLDF